MEKKEFLEKLARALAGQVSQPVIEENLRYYDTYLTEEAAKGKTMHQVLEELGDPRLIAKSIIDAHGGGSETAGIYEESSRSADGTYQEEEDFGEKQFRRFYFRGIWAMVVLVVVLCLILLLVGTIIGGIFLILRPILIPLLLIWLVYWIFRRPSSW